MAAPMEQNVEIREIDSSKGKGLFARTDFKAGEAIFEERPLVCTQFLWNELYKYTACEFCLKSMETAQEQCQRLTENPTMVLPHPECDPTDQGQFVCCPHCQVKYCCSDCQQLAWQQYHQTLCLRHSRQDETHPLNRLQETWRNIHFPPETSSITLIAKMIAMVKQADNKKHLLEKFKRFVKATVNEEEAIVHKLLGEQFQEQLEILRQQITELLYEDSVKEISSCQHDTEQTIGPWKLKTCMEVPSEWFTPEGFRSLFALIGTNGQGIASSSVSVWVKNCEKLSVSQEERESLDMFIDQMYEDLDKVSGTFLDCEGSGLYSLQSACNHSCLPNAEITFPYNNHTMAVVATEDIKEGQEICICYLSECDVNRSRHSRQKILRENYLFTCGCPKCVSEADEPDVTSEEEDEEMEDDD